MTLATTKTWLQRAFIPPTSCFTTAFSASLPTWICALFLPPPEAASTRTCSSSSRCEVTLWHYQWLLVNEHLPQIVGQDLVNDVLQKGNRFYSPLPGDAFMPIEFGAAAYRFGHSMVRPSYRANFTSGTGDSTSPTADPFFALVFDSTAANFSGPVNYEGLLRSDPTSYLSAYPGFQPFLGTDLVLGHRHLTPTSPATGVTRGPTSFITQEWSTRGSTAESQASPTTPFRPRSPELGPARTRTRPLVPRSRRRQIGLRGPARR